MPAVMIPDDLWELIQRLVPPPKPKLKGGRPRVPDRACLTGILFVLRSGIPWVGGASGIGKSLASGS